MTYSDEDIERQLRLGEDSHWEFKEIEFAGNHPKSPGRNDWADEIAAFANANGGVLLCGVTDKGEVQDMSREQLVELDSLLVEVSSDTIKPAVRIRTHHKQLPNGKRLLLVDVPEGDSQHDSSPGGSYVRVGGSKRKMTSDERLRLAQRRGQARFLSFDEQTVSDTGFRTLDESLWKPLLSAEGAADPEAALMKLALLATDEAGISCATVAGVLLCTRNPEQWLPNACIMATRYRGKDRASGQIDAQEITGPLNRQIADAVAFALRNRRTRSWEEGEGTVDLHTTHLRDPFPFQNTECDNIGINCNGIVQVWVNGSLKLMRSDLKLVGNDDVKINRVWADLYYGGSNTPDSYQYIRFDKMEAASALISAKPVVISREALPSGYTLHQNYPNPFNPSTRIRYSLSGAAPVTLKIYNAVGQVVKTLVDEHARAGEYEIQWDGLDSNFREVTNGVYFYQMKVGDFTDTKKMILAK